MHIHGNILEQYVRRELPPNLLAALDAHISNCLFCAHSLADRTAAGNTWERHGLLQRLVPVAREPEARAA